MNTEDKKIIKRVLFLTMKYGLIAYIFQCVAMYFAFLMIFPLFIIPEFYLTWVTKLIVHDDMDLVRPEYILLQLAINTCVCAVLFTPAAYWWLKRKHGK